MKKRLFLLITLIISLFIYCGSVEAAKELTCMYPADGLYSGESLMISQDSNGNLKFYYGDWYSGLKLSNYSDEELCSTGWQSYSSANIFYDDGTKNDFVDSDGYLNSCPKYCELRISDTKYFFSNNRSFLIKELGSAKELKVDKDNSIDSICDESSVFSKSFSFYDDLDDKINDSTWINKCKYTDFDLYFNENDYIIYIVNDKHPYLTGKFSPKKIIDLYNGKCPSVIYRANKNLYLEKRDLLENFEYQLLPADIGDDGNNDGNTEVTTCKELFGDEIYDKINEYFGIVKIVIPILLIGFGILDFSKAIFSGEDNMKKSRKKFVMRIIAAILFFLIPTFLKLFLSIANTVWDFINTDTCIR